MPPTNKSGQTSITAKPPYLERFEQKVQEMNAPEFEKSIAKALADPALSKTIPLILEHSPYLTQNILSFPDFTTQLFQQSPDNLFQSLMTELDQCDLDQKQPQIMKILRETKRKAALLIAWQDLANAWSLDQVTEHLSTLAAQSIKLATCWLLRHAHDKGHIYLPDPTQPENDSGFFVLAMGKLGAYELNYSSDIDLVVLYDPDVTQTDAPENLPSIFVRLTRDLVKMLEERTADGYVFRTDLRLRPDPGSTPLAVSFSAAELYYGSLGQNWERAAMIKARPIAGDMKSAESFMEIIRAWVWRKNLDFAAIQDIHSIKRQINTHKVSKQDGYGGYDIKLGHGGIREIEFFAQTQQLIYGGKIPDLRTSKTVDSLHELKAQDMIAEAACNALSSAYAFLRQTEHRLQMINDQQTHSLPIDEKALSDFARFAGFDTTDSFLDVLYQHITTTQKHYRKLFEESSSLAETGNLVFTGNDDDPDTIETLHNMGFAEASRASSLIRAWHHGRYQATRSERARQILTELVPSILNTLSDTTHPDDAFLRFDKFLSALPTGVPIFSLFQQNPDTLELISHIMGTAPRLAGLLGTNPSVIEAVLTKGFYDSLPDINWLREDLENQLKAAQNYEDTLDLIRRWAREKRFQVGVHVLKCAIPCEIAGRHLSDIAETALTTLITYARQEFEDKHGKFKSGDYAILALGRFGSQEMSFDSDLDLIAIYDPPGNDEKSDGAKPLGPNEYYIRFTQRLVTALTSLTTEGKLYEIDLRLRPTGNAGPLAISLEGFLSYQKQEAWTWEHMSLTRARVITGKKELRHKIQTGIQEILQTKRDPKKLRDDILSMHDKIKSEFGADDPWELKYAPGGLVDILFILQYLVLKNASDYPAILQPDTILLFQEISDAGLIDSDAIATLKETYLLSIRIQGFLRLCAELPFRPDNAPDQLKQALAESALAQKADITFESLNQQRQSLAAETSKIYEKIFAIDESNS